MHFLSPTTVLAAVLIAIGAQISWIVSGERGRYFGHLVLAAVGFILGEVVAVWLQMGGPTLGSLHIVADAAGVAVFEFAGRWIASPDEDPGHG